MTGSSSGRRARAEGAQGRRRLLTGESAVTTCLVSPTIWLQ